ncbi:MAG: transcription antitermination factor NusB [Chlorobi bacterium]|nr:transcription antitermination factor NusB [Chlorobiota bacterium]
MFSRRLLREKVVQSLFRCMIDDSCQEKDVLEALKTILKDYYKLYILVLYVIVKLHDEILREPDRVGADQFWTEEERENLRKIGNNPIVERLRNSSLFSKAKNLGISELVSRDFILGLYNDLEKEKWFREYVLTGINSKQEAERFFWDLVDWLLKQEKFQNFLDEHFAFWKYDFDSVMFALLKTVERIKSSFKGDPVFQEDPKKWERNWQFAKNLVHFTLQNASLLDEEIAKQLKNWELERLSLMDRLLMRLALTEWLSMPEIPVLVTLDEYVKLSDNMSKPDSPKFVNGVLNALLKRLADEGRIPDYDRRSAESTSVGSTRNK